jgi:hypothetical protein
MNFERLRGSSPLAGTLCLLSLPPFLSSHIWSSGRLWATGQAVYTLRNSDYNYYAYNGRNAANPATSSLPVKDTEILTAKTQMIFSAGARNYSTGTIAEQGNGGYYWSTVPVSATNGYALTYDSFYVQPVTTWAGNVAGYSIRCVRI